ncbi:MAG: hypothetical protein DRP47_00670 [Candidatus Zixiibacteriota bacterium]|nr:MAG: hypothetical protein DRP47_00670 [candidate division Zixibacteria bacterium]
MNTNTHRESSADIVEQVNSLAEEVKILALNLAIYLAKAKKESGKLTQLEPDFIRLVNGTVRTVHELTAIISASRSNSSKSKTTQFEPSFEKLDPLEAKLRNILDQCQRIITALSLGKELNQ